MNWGSETKVNGVAWGADFQWPSTPNAAFTAPAVAERSNVTASSPPDNFSWDAFEQSSSKAASLAQWTAEPVMNTEEAPMDSAEIGAENLFALLGDGSSPAPALPANSMWPSG